MTAYGVFDRDFGFDSHEWSCADPSPASGLQTVDLKSVVPLGCFIAATVGAITCMGGTYAQLPAYEAALFGAKYVGPIHGRLVPALCRAMELEDSISPLSQSACIASY